MTVNRKVVFFGILAVATVLMSIINLYLRRDHYGAVGGYYSKVRFLVNSKSITGADGVDVLKTLDQQPLLLSSNGTKGYLLTLYVLEQLTMSTSHYISLLNLAHSWGLSGVEPTICHSRMYGLPGLSGMCHQEYNPSETHSQLQRNTVEVRYGRLYNLSYLNEQLGKCLHMYDNTKQRCKTSAGQTKKTPRLVIGSLDDFVRTSCRNIILVHFVRGIGGGANRMPFLPHKMMHNFEDNVTFPEGVPIVDCTQLARDYGVSGVVEHLLNKVAITSAFVVQRVVCINSDRAIHGIDVTLLKNAIFDSLPNVSVVFTKWQNRGIIGRGSEILSRCKLSPIPHSQEVISASKRFLSSTDVQEPFVAVHLRLERLYQCEALIPGYTKCCVSRLSSLLSEVLNRHSINKKDVLIIKDYGPYGTDSCSYKQKYVNISVCLNLTKDFLTNLRQFGYNANEFIPRHYGEDIPDNSGFVSLVEAEAVLSGSVLIAGGFGSYQGTIIKTFLGISDPKIGFKNFDNERRYDNSILYDRVYRVCTCRPLKGHSEKLNRIDLGTHSCEDV